MKIFMEGLGPELGSWQDMANASPFLQPGDTSSGDTGSPSPFHLPFRLLWLGQCSCVTLILGLVTLKGRDGSGGLGHAVPSSTGPSTASAQQGVLPLLGILSFLSLFYFFTEECFIKPRLSRAIVSQAHATTWTENSGFQIITAACFRHSEPSKSRNVRNGKETDPYWTPRG